MLIFINRFQKSQLRKNNLFLLALNLFQLFLNKQFQNHLSILIHLLSNIPINLNLTPDKNLFKTPCPLLQMTEEVLIEISLIIGIAAITSIIARAIKKPLIIAYLISGILVSPLVFGIIKSDSLIQIFAHLGVALLLFIVGLSLDYRVLKDIGGVAVFAGIGEIIVTGIIGFLIAIGLGLSYTPAVYRAAALACSSTIGVVKILSDKKETDTLHGRIAIGILIVEDFIAALVLMILPVIETGTYATILAELGKIALLISAILAVSALSFTKLTHYLAKSQEVLFLFGIGWALTIAALFNYLGFSLEICALIAGMSLASTKYTMELSSKIKPL